MASAASSASRCERLPASSSSPIGVRFTRATAPASISRSTRITEMPVSRSPERIALLDRGCAAQLRQQAGVGVDEVAERGKLADAPGQELAEGHHDAEIGR